MSIAATGLTPLEQTAFLTEYARALDSRAPRPILGDTVADEVVGRLDYDFAALAVPTNVVCQTVLRAKLLDDRVRDFVARHPDAVVVDLGAGLGTPMLRVRPPAGVDWYSVDLPPVIALREAVLPAAEHAHSVPASVADDWTAGIPADRPTMVIADGLFAFVPQPVMAELFRRITAYFHAGELAFNDYGRVGRVSRAVMKLARQPMFHLIDSVWANPGFKDARTPETWNPRLRLVEEASVTHAAEVALCPRLVRLAIRLTGTTKAGARGARILRYRFGVPR